MNFKEKIEEYQNPVIKAAEKELDEFKMNFEMTDPEWCVLAQKAKYDFMRSVYHEISNFVFAPEEPAAIVALGGFLNRCWLLWNERGGTIMEIMEIVAERYPRMLKEQKGESSNDN